MKSFFKYNLLLKRKTVDIIDFKKFYNKRKKKDNKVSLKTIIVLKKFFYIALKS